MNTCAFRDWLLLKGSLLFEDVDPASMASHLAECKLLVFHEGELVLRPDRRNRHVYVLVEGLLRVFLKTTDEIPLNNLRPGECAGELTIIDNGYPTAFVVAARQSVLVAIPHSALWAMVNVSHGIARNLLHIMARRVRNTSELIAQHHRELKRYELNSILDPLTDLHNRRWMEETFAREVLRSQTSGIPMCMIILDIDNFKHYNDVYGHLMGDEVLRAISQMLRDQLRAHEMAARFGGDEIALLLLRTRRDEAAVVAERLRKSATLIRLPDRGAGVPPSPTLSIGVAELADRDTPVALLERADAALYEAKRAGRNKVEVR